MAVCQYFFEKSLIPCGDYHFRRGLKGKDLLQREQAIALLHNLMAEVSATLESTLTGADAAGIGQGTLSCDLGVRSIDGSDVAGVVGDNISVAVIALHN